MKPLTLRLTPSTLIIIILSILVIAMLALWRPWEGSKAERTISVTGQAEVQATPDEFVFSPYFQRTGTDSANAKSELDTFGTKLISDLEKLGLAKKDIIVSGSSYGSGDAMPVEPGSKPSGNSRDTVTLSVTIKAPSKELAQKVQDYLASTDAKGQLTAQPNFSQEKRRELEDQARDKAIEDARKKADRTAKNLSASLGKVMSVKDSKSQGGIEPAYARDLASDGSASSLPVTPGEQTVDMSVEVVFELR